MARTIDVNAFQEDIQRRLLRSIQSGRINVLLGSGMSHPAIPPAGQIEADIGGLLAQGQTEQAEEKMTHFLGTVCAPTNDLLQNGNLPDPVLSTLAEYQSLLKFFEQVLISRRTTLLPRQISVFSTNYDLFVEKASEACPAVTLNDGFGRAVGLEAQLKFSTKNYFRSEFNVGNLNDYKVEVPSVNLIKLHWSLTWLQKSGEVYYAPTVKAVPEHGAAVALRKRFLDSCSVVLPQASKFHETTMNRVYYDLLRIFANALDLENTVLLVMGFSFGDEHIRDITLRALKNPTLRLMIFAFDDSARQTFENHFQQYPNVDIIHKSDGTLTAAGINAILHELLSA